MYTEDLLNWQQLYNWTEKHEPNAVVGESCTNSLCPLASYLNEVTNRQSWSVGPSIKLVGTAQRLDKPAWITALIEKTDEATGKQRAPVTREQFLVCLEEVKEAAPTRGDPEEQE